MKVVENKDIKEILRDADDALMMIKGLGEAISHIQATGCAADPSGMIIALADAIESIAAHQVSVIDEGHYAR